MIEERFEMSYGTVLIPIVVYLVVAALSDSARAAKATRSDQDHVTRFPIQKHLRIIVWASGLMCVTIGTYGVFYHEQVITSGLAPKFETTS